jgi:DNA-binding Xre family transcriptional regulator
LKYTDTSERGLERLICMALTCVPGDLLLADANVTEPTSLR